MDFSEIIYLLDHINYQLVYNFGVGVCIIVLFWEKSDV